ncbi:MAG: prolipoprotein diacylglyceryl transferase [Dehalococcoidales bacterium]|nr:prolipoprotein diacylglyceryl transferase [Dehalococcoidales bacterium]
MNVFYINVNPVIVQIGPVALSWYGLMVALGVITVVSWVAWQNRTQKILNQDNIFTVAVIGILSGMVFSKVLHVIDQFDFYLHYPGRIFSGDGLTIWGAVLGATIGIWVYSRISRQFPFLAFGDMIAPGIILSQAIGRIGCTFNGCCYGIESHSCLAVIWQHPNSYAPLGVPVLPTQIFELFYDLAVFGILLALKDRLKPEGALFAVYYSFYAAWRLGIDFIRTGTPFLFGLHQAQFIAVVILAITIPIIIMKVRWKKEEDDGTAGAGSTGTDGTGSEGPLNPAVDNQKSRDER